VEANVTRAGNYDFHDQKLFGSIEPFFAYRTLLKYRKDEATNSVFMKILMVCLGNICRSPLAEGIMKQKIKQRGLDWEVDSAGTGSWHQGEKPDPRSIYTASQHGLDITSQRARQLQSADLDDYDLILAMDHSNYEDILRKAFAKSHEDKVKMIMEYVHPGKTESVPDPYWDDDGFEKVYNMLDEACERIVEAHQ
jgi:protein-tyrosine phosphatase